MAAFRRGDGVLRRRCLSEHQAVGFLSQVFLSVPGSVHCDLWVEAPAGGTWAERGPLMGGAQGSACS